MAVSCGDQAMSFSLFGLREVVPDQSGVEQWKELLLDTGGTHLALQDIKLPEGSTAGGYCYKDSTSVLTRNRFIYWQTSNDILELIEHSLDLNLQGNYLRIRFQGLPILEGTSVHATGSSIIVLVSTVSSVHCFTLPHPSSLSDTQEIGKSSTVPSIFTEASAAWLRDSPSHQLANSTTVNTPLPYTSASCLIGSKNDALFALANNSLISLIRIGQLPGSVATWTLQPASITRFFSGFIPSMLKGSSTQDGEDATASVALETVNDDVLITALSKGGKLRIWSATTQECRLSQDLTEYLGDRSVKQLSSSRHRIRFGPDLKLAAFLVFPKKKSFALLQLESVPKGTTSSLRVSCLLTVPVEQSHLIDFSLTSTHLYALWSSAQGEYAMHFFPLFSRAGADSRNWQSVVLQCGVDADVEYDDTVTDPKQAFMKAIFESGKFSVSTLAKALQAFQRSVGGTSSASIQVGALKEEIVTAIETELLEQVSDMELTEEDYVQHWHKCWAQFYAYVVQYHLKRPVPVGLLIDDSTGFHCLLKKGMISFLRPMDLVESLVLQKDRRWDTSPYSETSHLFSQQNVTSGLVVLLQVLSVVGDKLTLEQINRFDRLMFQLQGADQIALDIANELLQCGTLILLESMHISTSSSDICLALSALLQQLGVDMSNESNDKVKSIGSDIVAKAQYQLLFNGSLGISALTESSKQMADLRLALCRDVLITQQLLIMASEKLQLNPDDAEDVRSELLPRTVPLAHAYYALSWICQYPAQNISSSLIEQNARQMAILGFRRTSESYSWLLSSGCKSLVELFLSVDGGQATRSIVLQEEDMPGWSSPWLDAFPNFVKAVGQLLWPIGDHTTFMEFLMDKFQPLAIRGYVRLLQNWCEWNTCSRKFLMAVALVVTGEGNKASRWMLQAAEGISREELLMSLVSRNCNENEITDVTLRYYLICVQLLQQTGLSIAALHVALVALNSAVDSDPLLPTMWSIVAVLHLHLGHYQEAYKAIVSNPDSSQRPESLGRLVNTLLERKQMDILLTFPYVGLESELEKIVERRARSSDLQSMHVYYSFLYAFHIRQGKMRRAAYVMYEQALRYSCENELPKHVKCLLACLNSLRLVSREEAWLVKPVQSTGNPLTTSDSTANTVQVIEYSDIEKEYELSFACLNLGHSIVSLSHAEIVALLTSQCHYESALRVANIFDVKDKSPIVEHLAGNCVGLSRECLDEEEAWAWLAENHSSGVGKASDQAWKLLERILNKADGNGKQTRCHRAATRKILSLDCTVPYWLATSYKTRNPAELISVYHQAGFLEEATQVGLELLDATLGNGKKCYGLVNPLQLNSPAVWLPYSVFDQLIMELDANVQDVTYEKLLVDLQEKLQVYFDAAERASLAITGSCR